MKKCLEILIIVNILLIPVFIILAVPYIVTDKEVVVNYNEEYVDRVEAKSFLHDYSNDVITIGEVDTTKLGEYELKYKLELGILGFVNKKKVVVVDKENPSITLEGAEEVVVCPNQKYEEEGYTANDEYDGVITDKVEVINNDNEIIYKVLDSSKNEFIKKRTIVYEDKIKPEISLKGNSEVYIYKNSNYNEPGVNVSDNCDANINDKVKIDGSVDTSKTGTYIINYSVVDSNNNEAKVSRKVVVINRKTYTPATADGKIYLTFDDGPSYLTPKILDILDKEGIKATFFVTSNVYVYSNVVSRAYNSGHTIALHTYSHDYSYIYSSVDNYFTDLQKVSDAVYSIINHRSKITRFPGGSSNTISRNYKVGIMSVLSDEVVNRGYNYFDWNIDSNDAGSDIRNSNNIYNNVINHLSHNSANIILMHDSSGHEATVEALDEIIDFGKSNGYTFANLKEDMSAMRHSVNN